MPDITTPGADLMLYVFLGIGSLALVYAIYDWFDRHA